jgi:hypothetical protein
MKAPLLACSCGFPPCDALLVRITPLGDRIVWDDFEWYRRPDVAIPLRFEFDAEEYGATLAQAAAS